VIYGCAYASELIHIASLLGAKAIIHIGSFGALQSDIQPGDIVLPERAYGNESVTRMYSSREQIPSFFSANEQLRAELADAVGGSPRGDSIVSIQAMLAETAKDVAEWQKERYAGVELECASVFAVAEHFNVPVAAALYAADSLINNLLVTDADFTNSQSNRQTAKNRIYVATLKTLFNRMQK
jgi:uridine phosphorylase